jgi:predicted nucleotidyltransferase
LVQEDKPMTTIKPASQSLQTIDAQLKEVLTHFPKISFAMLFGSVAAGRQRAESDLDIAVAAEHALTADEKIALINALAASSGRPVDVIDLKVVSEPLLGQILRHGRRLLGNDTFYGELISRHLFEQADFMPYRTRLLAERRKAWIGK